MSREPARIPGGGGVGEISLLVVIVNFRTPGMTIDCLQSLEPEIRSAPGSRVVVVDNHSEDGSDERIERAVAENGWSGWCEVRRSGSNLGFAGGNAAGLRAGGNARYVLALNSDTIVHPGVLAHCLKVMDGDAMIGAMSCRLRNADGSSQNVARRFPTPFRLVAGDLGLPWAWPSLFGRADTEDAGWNRETSVRDVDWLGGAFFLMRGDLVREIGFFDTDFFFYGEDIVLSHRIRRAGKRRLYDSRVSITHLGGCSSDPTRMPIRARSEHAWRARYMVQRKCYGVAAEWCVRIVDTVCCAARIARLRLAGRGQEPRCGELRSVLSILCRPLMRARDAT